MIDYQPAGLQYTLNTLSERFGDCSGTIDCEWLDLSPEDRKAFREITAELKTV